MPQKSGMFDSTVDDPREYPAREFAEYFARFVTNGIFNGGPNLQVTASGADANVKVAIGAAWIKGYAYSVYDSPLTLAIAPATTLDRVDRIILRLDTSTPVRSIKSIIVQGTPSASPTAPVLVRSGDNFDLSLAQVRVVANSSIVTQANITDERFNESVCGLVNSLIRVDTATFQQQWDVFLATIQNQGFATPASVDAKIVAHNDVANAHGATSVATANRIIVRDAAGRAKVAPPSLADDIARLDTVNNAVGSLANLLTTAKTNAVAAINELFLGAVDVKTKVANAISGKNIPASPSDSGDQLAAKIGQISTGKKVAQGSATVGMTNYGPDKTYVFDNSFVVSTLNFRPSKLIIKISAIPATGFVYEYTYAYVDGATWRDSNGGNLWNGITGLVINNNGFSMTNVDWYSRYNENLGSTKVATIDWVAIE